MNFSTYALLIAAISSQVTNTVAFSPSFNVVGNVPRAAGVGGNMRVSTTTIFSSSSNEQGEDETTPTPKTDALTEKSVSFTQEPIKPQRLDPLVASLTRDDSEGTTATTKVPLLGEIPADGSIIVLAPVTLIAVVGFIMSINIALNSKDLISQQLEQVNTVLSTPPVKKEGNNDNGCRGLCSNEQEQFDTMSRFMNNLAPKKD